MAFNCSIKNIIWNEASCALRITLQDLSIEHISQRSGLEIHYFVKQGKCFPVMGKGMKYFETGILKIGQR